MNEFHACEELSEGFFPFRLKLCPWLAIMFDSARNCVTGQQPSWPSAGATLYEKGKRHEQHVEVAFAYGAVSGILSGGALAQQNSTAPADKKAPPKAEKNSCGGKNGCGSAADKKAADNKDSKAKGSAGASQGQDKNNKGTESQKPPAA